VLGDGDGERSAQRHSIAGEGFWQQTHFPKVKEARPSFGIDVEIALVHVGLGKDKPLMAKADGRQYWPGPE